MRNLSMLKALQTDCSFIKLNFSGNSRFCCQSWQNVVAKFRNENGPNRFSLLRINNKVRGYLLDHSI